MLQFFFLNEMTIWAVAIYFWSSKTFNFCRLFVSIRLYSLLFVDVLQKSNWCWGSQSWFQSIMEEQRKRMNDLKLHSMITSAVSWISIRTKQSAGSSIFNSQKIFMPWIFIFWRSAWPQCPCRSIVKPHNKTSISNWVMIFRTYREKNNEGNGSQLCWTASMFIQVSVVLFISLTVELHASHFLSLIACPFDV